MDDLKSQLARLNKNLNTLREREAKYAGNAPLDLLNQIDDHQRAIELVKQAINGKISPEELEIELAPLIITTGDILKSAVDMGQGAQVIINQARSMADEARDQDTYEKAMLAEAVVRIASDLKELVSPFAPKPATADISHATIIMQGTLIRGGKLSTPYKALLDYKIPDAPLFYGRRTAIRELFRLLQPGTLMVIHAESGAGKSSLLQAGLASRLLVRGHLPLLVRSWNQDPALAIKRAFIPNLSKVPGLAQAPLVDFLHQVESILGSNTRLYIFLDQFEEFFTQLDPERQRHFVNQLADCLEDETLSVTWSLALRDEYFGQIATFSPCIRNPYERQYLLQPLTYEEARQVVVEPAGRAKITYEDGLVEQILHDLNPQQKTFSPAEIQLVCSALFENLEPNEKVITTSAYIELGAASGILRGHLNRVLQQNMNAREREIARCILESLVTADNHRALRTLPELVKNTQTDEETITPVLQVMVDNRLVRVSDDKTTDSGAVYELAHSYLLAEIKIDPEVQARRAAQELLAREVQSFKRYGTLLDPQKLNIIQNQRDYLVLDEDARELLRQSQSAQNRTRRNRIAMGITAFAVLLVVVVSTGRFDIRAGAVAVIIFLILTVLGGRAWLQRNQAQHARRIALARGLSAEAIHQLDTDAELSLLLALEAIDQADIVQAEDILRHVLFQTRPCQILDTQSEGVLAATWTPSGQGVALGLKSGDIQLWNTETNSLQTLLAGHTEAVRCLQFSPDGALLASASALTNPLDFFSPDDGSRGAVHLWDVNSGQLHGILEGHSRGVFSLTWSPDGARLATASADGSVKLWDIKTLKETATLEKHTGKVRAVAWHPHRQLLASTGGEGEIFIWDLETLTLEQALTGHRGEVFDVAWSPNGCRLASAGKDGTVRTWDIVNGSVLDVLVGHQSFVRSVRWHPDSRQLASAAMGNNKIILWDTDTGQAIISLTGHIDWIRSLAWNGAGDRLVSASDDATARIWQVQVTPGVTVAAGHTDELNEVDWQPQGQMLATAAKDGTARVWDAGTGQCQAILTGHSGWVWDIAWRPDGLQLATTSNDGTVRLWNLPPTLAGGESKAVNITNPTNIFSAGKTTIFGISWSPDQQTLASAGGDKTIRLWDLQTGSQRQILVGHEGGVLDVDFSPDGTRLASSSADRTIILWDLATGKPSLTLTGHTNFVWEVAFSHNGQYLASAAGDSTARIWDVATGEMVARFKHARPVASVAWNHSSTRLASTSDDGVVYLWDVTSKNLAGTLTGHGGGVWGAAWSPDDTKLATAAADGLLRVFYTDFKQVLTLAREYKRRELTPAEREQFMGEPAFGETAGQKKASFFEGLMFR
ncbi:MAG: hypothetical protein JXM69_21015 [Anaerolineae bacterium]|nr:hypothetical protein [Anaerolineae bacterium]